MDFRGEPLHGQVKDGQFKEVKRIPHPSADVLKARGNKVKAVLPVESGGCVYKVRMGMGDGDGDGDGMGMGGVGGWELWRISECAKYFFGLGLEVG